jgi:hypothetical protein
MRFFRSSLVAATGLVVASMVGCAAVLTAETVVDGVDRSDSTKQARISLDPTKPVLLHAVDGRFLGSLQVSNLLRPVTYALRPGHHVLWVSEVPAGIPFLPQHINCFVMKLTLDAGSSYHLEQDPRSKLPTIRREGTPHLEAVGVLVDRAFLLERGCKWQ